VIFVFVIPVIFSIFLLLVLCILLCIGYVRSLFSVKIPRYGLVGLCTPTFSLLAYTTGLLILCHYLMVLLYILLLSQIRLCLLCGIISTSTLLGSGIVLVIDLASILFLFTLFMLSNSVLLFSYYYMSDTPSFCRFLGILLAFLLSIFGLVLCGSLLSFFVFWDLLGFSSFFLVIWYRSRSRISGGLLTGLVNRVGDCLFFVLFGLSLGFRTHSFIFLVLLVLVSFTKSAQIPFSSWLPAAIAAPTPVSSLVHSSTLVTAGVYLLYRFVPLESSLLVCAGIATTLMAGLGAFTEADLKKIVAFSTIRQLGLIFTSLGLGLKSLTFLHLNLHASSKALLFMAIGLLIHTNYGSQEYRMPPTWVTSTFLIPFSITVSCFSMCGITCLRGWVSKDYILSGFYSTSHSNFVLTAFLVGIFLTVSYSARLVRTYLEKSVSYTSSCSSLPLPALLKFSLVSVFFLVIVQGISINVKSYPLFAVLSSWAFVVLASTIGLGILFAAVYKPVPCLSLPCFTGLRLCTLYTSSLSVHFSNVIPVSSFLTTGTGLCVMPSLVSLFSCPALYLIRSCVLLVFFLIV